MLYANARLDLVTQVLATAAASTRVVVAPMSLHKNVASPIAHTLARHFLAPPSWERAISVKTFDGFHGGWV